MTATETRTAVRSTLDLRAGDEVILTKGDSVVRVTVAVRDDYRVLDLNGVGLVRIASFVDAGYTLEKVEKLPPVPTEPGVYESSRSPARNPYVLDGYGVWRELIVYSGRVSTSVAEPTALGTLTRLVPAPDTASPAAVIDVDGDRWTRNDDGTYTFDGYLTKTLEKIEADHGPVKTEGVTL